MVRPSLSAKVLTRLAGRRLATAESLTGGGIGQAVTSVSGASAVFAGGVISYTNEVKNRVLGVPMETLDTCGAVSAPVAKAMAEGARRVIGADVAVAVTGLAGPGVPLLRRPGSGSGADHRSRLGADFGTELTEAR